MSNVVVYVFLFDNLSGFSSVLNETVLKNTPDFDSFPRAIRPCDHVATSQILKVFRNELSLHVPVLRTNSDNSISAFDDSREVFYKTYLEDLPDTGRNQEFFEKAIDTFDFNSRQVDREHTTIHECSFTNHTDVTNLAHVTDFANVTDFPNVTISNNVTTKVTIFSESTNITEVTNVPNVTNISDVINVPDVMNVNNVTQISNFAPFLGAIFETISNVTAQTCAGTLISPHWMLTAASCVNILSGLYTDDKNMTHTSETLYTIVAGALNPLIDGSTHNVTSVLVARNISIPSNSSRVRKGKVQSPYLAMMRIEPEYEGDYLSLTNELITSGEVTIYGWTLIKNESGLDVMVLVKLSAHVLSIAECQAMYSFINNDIICLRSNDESRDFEELSSGGPVLVQQGAETKMLAVVQTDDNKLLAYPLSRHIDWIKEILNT